MIPEVLYFPAYVCVLDKKIYDECYFKMLNLLETEKMPDDVKEELLKILGDDDNKISLDNVLRKLKEASKEDKETAITLGLDVALADDYWADDEDRFFKEACLKMEYPKHSFQILFENVKKIADQERDKDIARTRKLHGQSFYQLMSKIVPKNLKNQFEQRYVNCLLSGSDYSNIIKSMRKISDEDIVYAKEALESISAEMTMFLDNLSLSEAKIKNVSDRLHKKSGNEQDIEKCLDGIKSHVTEFVKDTQTQISGSLKQKEIAAKYYTISFMGRTKAGKSTLHSVILGGINKEFIGVGKERTTRLNRIYKWQGIRIIDTPGIGAPGGQTDTEIAKSIVDESDLICYVVTTDSIQETEFAFLKELKKQNKPIIILLNKKENLNHPIHKKRFLEKPLYWYERTDNDALEGHLTRIKEYAQKYYNNSYFDIYPVQLMAAQLAINEKDVKIKDKLYKGSRIQQFLDGLRVQILENGKIKRSQTMLNGTIYSVGNYKQILESQLKELAAIKNSLEQQFDSSIAKLRKAGIETQASLKKGLKSTYNNFIQSDIRTFANEHYATKRHDVDSQWKKFYEQTGFEKRIRDRVECESENYKSIVEEIIQQFTENFTFSLENLAIKFNLKSTFDIRTLCSITGSIASLAGSILLAAIGISSPVGWVFVGVGLLVGLAACIFKSKNTRIKEAQDKLYESIKKSFEENMDKNIEKIVSDFKKITNQTENQIVTLFKTLISELDKLIHNMEPLEKNCLDYETKLNKLYALRILNFARKKEIFDINNASLLHQIKVKHDFAKKITIETDLIKQIDSEKLKYILQEDVVLEAL